MKQFNNTPKIILLLKDSSLSEKVKTFLKSYPLTVESFIGLSLAKTLVLLKKPNPILLFIDSDFSDNYLSELYECTLSSDFCIKLLFVGDKKEDAFRAINFGGVAFLPIPITKASFLKTFKRAMFALNEKIRLQNLEYEVELLRGHDQRIKVEDIFNKRAVEVKIKDIIRCEAQGDYTYLYVNGIEYKRIVIKKGIGECEEMLVQHNHFIRSHRSHLLNLSFVGDISKISSNGVKLLNGEVIPVSRRKRKEFKDSYRSL